MLSWRKQSGKKLGHLSGPQEEGLTTQALKSPEQRSHKASSMLSGQRNTLLGSWPA